MSRQVQINSIDRAPTIDDQTSTQGYFSVLIPGPALTGWWELSYAVINNAFSITGPSSYFLYITIEGADTGLVTPKRNCSFSIGITVPSGANQEYTPRNRRQVINFGPTGQNVLKVKVRDNTGAIVNFDGADWTMILQPRE